MTILTHLVAARDLIAGTEASGEARIRLNAAVDLLFQAEDRYLALVSGDTGDTNGDT